MPEPGKGETFWGMVKKIGKNLLPDQIEKVEEADINPKTVALIIKKYLNNPLRAKVEGEKGRWANPFSIVEVMVYLGYPPVLTDDDLFKKYRGPYAKTREALTMMTLGQNPPLKRIPLKEVALKRHELSIDEVNIREQDYCDSHNEWQYYTVVRPEKLK